MLRPTDPENPPTKRRKIPLACGACRDRKSRCDGARPICSACGKRKTASKCVYEESTLRTQRDIAVLESRVKELESSRILSTTKTATPLLRNPPLLLQHGNVKTGAQDLVPKHEDSYGKGFDKGPELTADIQTHSSPCNPLTVGSNDHQSGQMYGKSSTASFVQSLKRTIVFDEGPFRHTQHECLCKVSTTSSTGSLSRRRDTSAFSLPMRKEADRYLDCYWQYVHTVFPILHWPSFMASYHLLWLPEEEKKPQNFSATDDSLFLATLSIVFAIGSLYDETIQPSRKVFLAEQLYMQSRNLARMDEMDTVSLPTVQFLLMTGFYLLNSRFTNRCWNMMGLAIRNAQSLGLHDETRAFTRTQLDREMRRRVWYNCVHMDRLVATIFGRPHMIIQPSNVPFPMMVDDEYLLTDGEGLQPSGTISYLGLFLASIKLFRILHDVVAACYESIEPPSPSTSTVVWWRLHRLDDILKLDSTLSDFWASLPDHLRLQNGSAQTWANETSVMRWMHAKILQSRFLYVRALLMRPLLLSAAQARKDSSLNFDTSNQDLGERLALQACLKGVETVHELVTAIYSSLHVNYQSPEWVTHYIFSCAMVIAAARICTFPEVHCSAAALQVSWNRCIAVLMHYKEHIPSAPYAVQVLETLQQGGARKPDQVTRIGANDNNVTGATGATGSIGATEQSSEALNSDWSYPLPDVFADFDFSWLNDS